MNKCFDRRFPKRESISRRNYEIDDVLYSRLEEMSNYYEATITELVNACIENLISADKIVLYQKRDDELLVKHTLMIRESNIVGLEALKEKYGVSIYRLVNIAIRATLDEDI